MTDLAGFLLARIADDEADARAAYPGPWTIDGELTSGPAHQQVVDWIYDDNGPHIARWDPARVLAECEAKQRIVEEHKPFRRIYGVGCDVCLQPRNLPADAPGWPCLTVRLLALPYADHPDYRQEWRP